MGIIAWLLVQFEKSLYILFDSMLKPWCCCDVDFAVAGLKGGVTDSGLHALASAGCGSQLTYLFLESEQFCVMTVLWSL